MRIMLVNVFQDWGSTGRIVTNLAEYMQQCGHTPILCYRDGSETDGERNFCIGRRLETALSYRLAFYLGKPHGFAWLSTMRLISAIRKTKPDVLNLHSINGSYINIVGLIRWLKWKKIPTVITHHSEYLYTGSCTHAVTCKKWVNGCHDCDKQREYHLSRYWDSSADAYRRMQCAFDGFLNCSAVAVSDWVLNRAVQSAIMKGIRHVTIENGVDESVFYPRCTEPLRTELGLQDKKVVFFSSACFTDREDDNKGGRYIIELAQKLSKYDICVVVAALTIEMQRQYDNVLVVGSVTDPNKLAEFYSLADVMVLASKRETFSMPLAEAMMCGTPVAGFCAGGPETIAIPDYSRFSDYGDTDSLCADVVALMEENFDRNEMSEAARSKYSLRVMCQRYCEVIEEAVKEK